MFKAFDDIDADDFFYAGGDDSEPELDKDDKNDPRNKYKDDMDGHAVKNVEKGLPNRERCCTDIICLVVYILFIASMIYITGYGLKNGQVNKLTAPIDGAKNFCGFDDYKEYPKMVFTDLGALGGPMTILNSGVCVKKCPDGEDTVLDPDTDYKGNAGVSDSGKKISVDYKTYDLMDYCIPVEVDALTDAQKKGYNAIFDSFKDSGAGKVFMDMYTAKTAIQVCFGLSFIWSLIFIYLMSIFAETLAWCCIVLIELGLLGATVACYFMWSDAKKRAAGMETRTDITDDEKAEGEKGPAFFMFLMILFGVLSLVFCCLVVCARKSLQRAIDVIDASADFIAHNKRVIAVPIIHFVLQLIVACLWFGAFVCVASLNEITYSTLPQVRDLKWEKKNSYLALYMFFGLLWLTAFIDYTSRFVTIVSATTYYFNNSRDRPDEEASAEICYGFKCAYLHHPGSIALGSFIIALIRFIKFVFYYLAKKAEKLGGDNGCVKCMIACATCILNCIERIVDYLNESAFCYMAVTGDHFLSSAWEGFLLNLKHGLKFTFANMIAKVFIFVGKIGIVVGNCFTLYFIMNTITKDNVSSPWGPIILVGFVTYLAASLFLSLFEEAVMALLTCLCVDIDVHKGEPIYGPATFHDDHLAKVKGKKTHAVE